MKRHLALALICFVLAFTLLIVSHLELHNSDTEIVKKEVVKHERRKNVLHDDGKTTEVFSHTIRHGDTMTVEIDTFTVAMAMSEYVLIGVMGTVILLFAYCGVYLIVSRNMINKGVDKN